MGTTCFKYILVILFVIFLIWNINWMQVYVMQGLLLARQNMSLKQTVRREFRTPFPVDVVYTWVNGSDPRHRADLDRLYNELRRTKSLSAMNALSIAPMRFADNGALRFSLRSLEKYANWIRNVFIVTNGQIPEWLNLHNPRVTIVKHQELFDDATYLPTFSALAIEHNIHKIRGLSEKFIYMNDDFFFGRHVSLRDFYTERNATKVYLAYEAPRSCSAQCKVEMIKNDICDDVCNYDHCAWDGGDCDDIPVEKRPKDIDAVHCVYAASNFYTSALYNKEFGHKYRRVVAHSPLFMDKRVKQELDKRFPREVNATSHRKLRSPLDLSFAFSYVHFFMEAYNFSKRFEVEIESRDVAFTVISIKLRTTQIYLDMLRNNKRKFICINDDIDYKYPSEATKAIGLLRAFYYSMFPNQSSFELHV